MKLLIATCLQMVLDGFRYARKHTVAILAYLTLRIYGIEVAFSDVKEETYTTCPPAPWNLDTAKDIDTLLKMSEESAAKAEKRRSMVTDKCKTLLTLGSLLLGVAGLLLPKYLAFDSQWMRVVAVLAVAALFNAIIILLTFFDVGKDMKVSLSETDIPLDATDLKKSLLNSHLQCTAASESRTNYLVDLYRASRFCFLSGLTLVGGLALTRLLTNSPSDQTQRIVREIRSDPNLIELLRGPKGDTGEQGDRGPQGPIGPQGKKGEKGKQGDSPSVDEIVSHLMSDPRLREAVKSVIKTHETNKTSS